MRIDQVDFFYLSMPDVTEEGDGSQDALLVRVTAGDHCGWGECEASPLASIAAWVAPMSHGACRPVRDSVLGQSVATPADIARIAALVARNSMDLLQAQHTWSGIEIALWDLLGRARGVPVWSLLGYERTYAKTPYASVLFGDTPQETLERGGAVRARGFAAAKFGWGPFGAGTLAADVDQLQAAREGLGAEGKLLVDAGQIWGQDVAAATARLPALEAVGAVWLEEPFHAGALDAYAALQKASARIGIAGGEAAHNDYMARHIIDHGRVKFVQIDCGRIGGIGPAKAICDYAATQGVTYVNHTFTSHLALSASLQPFAGREADEICEFPAMPKQLAIDITSTHLALDGNGQIRLGDAPGLGIEVDPRALDKYLVPVDIRVKGHRLF